MTIRTLRHGDLPPEGVEPRRYKNSQGYIRLRWLAAPGELVECYEHRWVMGNPPADVQVHHINHIRDDNRPENLKVVTPMEHGGEHRQIDRDEAVRLYRAGLGTPAIGRRMGFDAAAIWRALRDAGEPTRDHAEAAVAFRADLPAEEVKRLYTQGVSARRLARIYGVAPHVIDMRIREWGLPRHRTGRQTAERAARAEAAIAEVLQ